MPRRDDLSSILVIGSGPIIIGQACEFDYSGTQACRVLTQEGYRVVLANSNPATIMTDPATADATYVEPLDVDVLTAILERERPDAILPTLGGQTALNLTMELAGRGVPDQLGIEIIGARPEAIETAEDRDKFKSAMTEIGLSVPESGFAHSLDEAIEIASGIGFPIMVRPSYILGGQGTGIAKDATAFVQLAQEGLAASPVSEILVERAIRGWKEYELEVMRDVADNCVVICSIENVDPMGVHTGDSITVAPAQTLSDVEYQAMRDDAFACLRRVGVETGGSNVQFAVDPATGERIVIEMNPRVSRSSALASKATGFPIAKIAARLAVGYRLDEITNDITAATPASFEPTIDYVVTKIPRWAFEKLPGATDTLGTRMQSVGEVMAIGRTFPESLQKAVRSLEQGRSGLVGRDPEPASVGLDDAALLEACDNPTPDRLFLVAAALERGLGVKAVADATAIDPWFLSQIELITSESDAIRALGLTALERDELRHAKRLGFSDRQLADLIGVSEAEVFDARVAAGVTVTFKTVDTCAAEFEAFTPYHFGTYEEEDEVEDSDKERIVILGSGPNRIGQGIEFDYCCVHAAFALKEEGFETIMVNSNPETVSTDYDTSDKLFFEPLTLEDVLNIYEREQCDAAVVQFGGQTPLNLAAALQARGVTIIGTQPKSIEMAEDRKHFAAMIDKLKLRQTSGGTATGEEEAVAVADKVGYPVLVRPSFVLGGRAMEIVYTEEDLRRYIRTAVEVSPERPILVDRFLEDATEVDVDCLADGEQCVIGGIMEHIEEAGIHSGDSACVLPTVSLSPKVLETIRSATKAMALELDVRGLMNVQYAVKDEEVYVLEVNPRASRTSPFVSKAIGFPLAKLAAKIMAGRTLHQLGFTEEVIPKHYSVKEAVFPFIKFPGIDITLGPEMRSTGEVMGIDTDFPRAYAKAQMAAAPSLPTGGNIFVSVKDSDKQAAVPIVREFADLGFRIHATDGTAALLQENGIAVTRLNKIAQGRPNVVDMIKNGEMHFIINTPAGKQPRADEVVIRATAVGNRIPIMTTLRAATASVQAIRSIASRPLEVKSLQEHHAKG